MTYWSDGETLVEWFCSYRVAYKLYALSASTVAFAMSEEGVTGDQVDCELLN